MSKNNEHADYEASAPAVKAHFHALRAEEAWRHEEYAVVEREARLASVQFLDATKRISDKRTVGALLLLAENYEYRASAARARLPEEEHIDGDKECEDEQDTVDGSDTHTDLLQVHKTSEEDAASGKSDEIQGTGYTPMSTGLESIDCNASAEAESQLNMAAAEMEELWRRLNELGLSTHGSSDKTNVLMSSRHLSSSLGDSFCLLPTKARSGIGVQATAIDGGSTLRAAIASRMRNQRVRLMEKQYGPRAVVDGRRLSPRPVEQKPSYQEGAFVVDHNYTDNHQEERRSTLSSRSSDVHDNDSVLQETVSHQKYEIVRLLNTIKTLSNENTTLVKKCETLSNVQSENRDIQEAMDKFKTHYNQKLVMIKRALEEWRRQKKNVDRGSAPEGHLNNDSAGLVEQIRLQQQQLQQLTEVMKKKDEQIAKYDKWYQTLKAGARAKRSKESATSGGGTGGSYANLRNIARDSFTNSNSLHDLDGGQSSTEDPMRSHGDSQPLSRPPAHPHPTRRAL